MKRAEIVAEARKWIDVPFLHQGRSIHGVDCVGMVINVGKAFQVPYEDLTGYARAPTDPKFLRHLRKYLLPAPINGNRIGMVGVFRQSIFPCHIGIFASNELGITLINSRADKGRVWEELYSESPTDMGFKLIGLLSFPGLED